MVMSDKEDQDENLKAFEAALAAMQPRTDRLDGRWRELLAKEAELSVLETAMPSSCASPAGHQFVCVHCGVAAPTPPAICRWALPTALAGMTTVAAILLVMLVAAKERPIASQPSFQLPASPTFAERKKMSEFRQAMSDGARSPLASNVGDASYLKLRDQVLRNGVDSLKPAVSEFVTAARATEAPLNYREQLQRLLEEQGHRGS